MNGLEASDLTAGYGNIPAIRNISLACGPSEVLSILGPNGAGKSTTLLAISGVVRPMAGSVRLLGRDVTGQPPYVIARAGLQLVPGDRGLFPALTVHEHLSLAERSRPARRSGRVPMGRADVLRQFPQLDGILGRSCGLLSGGEQQMLTIAKSLIIGPKVLLVDELSLGLAPLVVQALLPSLTSLSRELGMSLILVEQHYELALGVSTHAMVVNHGQCVLQGAAAELLADPGALEVAYFGVTAAAE